MTFYFLVRRLGYGGRVPLLMALLLGFGTLLWPYAKYLFREPLCALLLLLAAYCALGAGTSRRALLLAGFFGGLSLTARTLNGIALPALLVVAVLPPGFGWGRWARLWRGVAVRVGLFLAAAAVGPLILGVFNLVRFGNPLYSIYSVETHFSQPLPLTLYGLLLSPSKGIFVYMPILLAAAASTVRFWRTQRRAALLAAGVTLPYFLVLARYFHWYGGFAWGPRLLVAIVPFLLLPLAAGLDDGRVAEGARPRPSPLPEGEGIDPLSLWERARERGCRIPSPFGRGLG